MYIMQHTVIAFIFGKISLLIPRQMR